MNVLFIRSNPVSPDSRVEKEVLTLLKNGYNVSILAMDRSANYKIEKQYLYLDSFKIPIYRVGLLSSFGGGKKNFISLLKFQYEIFKFIKSNRKQYDIVHACDLDTALMVAIVSKFIKFKFIYDIFDYYPDSHGVSGMVYKVLRNLESFTINSSNGFILCSESRIGQIGSVDNQNVAYIHNTPIRKKKETDLDLINNKLKIAYIGILGNSRMILELLEIVSENPKYELHIGGFGQLEEKVIKYSQKYNNIIFYGKVNYDRTIDIERSCDIITALYDPKIKNHYYAAPNKFYEGVMLGKVLIMAKNTGMSDVVYENKLGEVIDYNKESLKEAIDRIYMYNDKEITRISSKGKLIYKLYYSWDEMEVRLLELYKGV